MYSPCKLTNIVFFPHNCNVLVIFSLRCLCLLGRIVFQFFYKQLSTFISLFNCKGFARDIVKPDRHRDRHLGYFSARSSYSFVQYLTFCVILCKILIIPGLKCHIINAQMTRIVIFLPKSRPKSIDTVEKKRRQISARWRLYLGCTYISGAISNTFQAVFLYFKPLFPINC